MYVCMYVHGPLGNVCSALRRSAVQRHDRLVVAPYAAKTISVSLGCLKQYRETGSAGHPQHSCAMKRKLSFRGYLRDATIGFVVDIWSPLQKVVNMACRKSWLSGESKDVRGGKSERVACRTAARSQRLECDIGC